MKTIDVKVIQDIINNYASVDDFGYEVVVDIQKAITPEPKFIKGELVEMSDDQNTWIPLIFIGKKENREFQYFSLAGGRYRCCRKVEKVNINMKKFEGGYCPCSPNDLVIVHFKGGNRKYDHARNIIWGNLHNSNLDVVAYHVINLLGDSDE